MSDTIRKIRVVSDKGHAASTRFLDADTGEDLKLPVESIHLYLDVKGRWWKADLTVYIHSVDVTTNIGHHIEKCAYCKNTFNKAN